MKTICALSVFILLTFKVFSQADSCLATFASTAPVIDGFSSDAAYTNWKSFNGTFGNNNIISFAAAWDNTFLYVVVNVSDNSLFADSPDPWNDDAVELYIDANHNHGSTYDSYDRQYRINYNSSALSGIGNTTGILHFSRTITNGFAAEYAIPWSILGVSPSAGMEIGFDIGNSDDDDGGNSDGGSYWKGNGNDWQNTSAFGHLVCLPSMAPNVQIINLTSDCFILPSTTLPLYWTSSNIDSLDLEYAISGGSGWTYVTRVAASSGHTDLHIPALGIGSVIMYRLTDMSNSSCRDTSASLTVVNSTARVLLRSNNRFNVYGLVSEDAAADTTIKVLTQSYYRIADSLNTNLIEMVTVDIYPNLTDYHIAMGWAGAPDWVVGNAHEATGIMMVSPYNPGPTTNFSGMMDVISHELIHNFVYKLANCYPPTWINEGIAGYLFSTTSVGIDNLCNRITLMGGKPSLDTLNSSAFAYIDGYGFAFTIAEFVSTHFARGKLRDFIASNCDYSVLGFSGKIPFQNAWYQFLDEHYPCGTISDTCRSQFNNTPPVIDGNATDGYYSNWVVYTGAYNNNVVRFSSSWDYAYLYVAAIVTDPYLFNDSPLPYDDDALELYLDANNNHATSYDSYDRQYRINYNSSAISGIGDTTGVVHRWKQTADGYMAEYAIPWANLGISALPELIMGFDLGNTDDNNGGNADGSIYWKGNGNNWQNTAAFGRVILKGIPGMAFINITAPTTDVQVFRSSHQPFTWVSSNTDSIYVEKSENGQAWQYITTLPASAGNYSPSFYGFTPGTEIRFRLSDHVSHLPGVITPKFTVVDSSSWMLLRSNSRFQVYGYITEDAAADTVIKVLTANFNRISDSLNIQLSQLVTVNIYPDIHAFHVAIGQPTAADWVAGSAFGETSIYMVSPYNPGSYHSFSGIIEIITHELVHCFVHKLANGYPPIWLNEGAATYIAYQSTSINEVCHYISQNGGKPDLSTLNSYPTFGNIGGYSFAYTIAEYIATELGNCELLSRFIESATDFSILGFADETAFTNAWHQFLDVKYPCSHIGINETSDKESFAVSPNPADRYFTISSADLTTFDMLLYSADGHMLKSVRNIHSSDYSVSLDDFANGVYYVVIRNSSVSILKKVIKNKTDY